MLLDIPARRVLSRQGEEEVYIYIYIYIYRSIYIYPDLSRFHDKTRLDIHAAALEEC